MLASLESITRIKTAFLPSPLIVATVAAQTRRLHVGTSVILLPLHHPVHVAEDVTTLDIISKGRVILGWASAIKPQTFRPLVSLWSTGQGCSKREWRLFASAGVGSHFPFMARTTPWTTSRYAPDHCRLLRRPCGLAPAPAAVRRAGRLGDAFVATPSTALAQTVRLVDIYRQAAVQAGRQPQVVLMRDAWVATSRAEAEAIYGPEVMMAYRYYWENRLAEFRTLAQRQS